MTSKITQEQVFHACKLLASQDKKITVDAVRLVIGSGSKSTITPLVRKWREQNPNLAYDPTRFIPMTDEAFECFKKTWVQSVMLAEERTSEEYNFVLETENNKLKAELMEYEKLKVETKTLKETQDKLFEALKQTNEKNGQLEARIQELESNK